MSSEIFDSFKDQFSQDVEQLETLIMYLSTPEKFDDAVNSLFRIFHNHKAITAYLEIPEIYKCVEQAETVLNDIRKDARIRDESQIDWLFILADQMYLWSSELELGVTDLSLTNEAIFSLIKVKEAKVSVNDALSKITLLYIDEDEENSQKYIPIFNKIFADIFFLSTIESLEIAIETYDPDLIMLTTTMINSKTYRALNGSAKLIPAIALVTDDSKKAIIKLMNQGVHYHLKKPLKSSDLKKTLHSIVKSHFSDRKLIISNKKIRTFLETLDPLDNTIIQIQHVCNDEHSSIADLIKVVKKDPVTSGMILSAAKSPIYAFKNITTIDQAVGIFGKTTVKALTLGGLSRLFSPINLSMYGINEFVFSQIAHLRMRLMINWYGKINKKHLEALSVAALLGNLGQILIGKEIKNLGLEDKFREMVQQVGVHEAEDYFLRTSTAAVSSDILYFWNMSPLLVDALSYSDNHECAVDEIRPFALACHVVFSLVPLTEAQIQPVGWKLKEVLEKANLNLKTLNEAIEKTMMEKND